MPADTLTISLTGPLAEKVLAAAEACGLTPSEWAKMALQRRMAMRVQGESNSDVSADPESSGA